MQFSLMLQPKPNITYKSWLKVTFQGAHAVSGTPDPPFGSYFFHGLSERPLELIVLFEVRMKQTVMIENHFLSGKIISISLQCHPFPPHPSSLNTDPAPPLTISETSPAHFIVGFSRGFFFPRRKPRLSDTISSTGRSSLRPSGAGGFAEARSTLQKRQTARITPKAKPEPWILLPCWIFKQACVNNKTNQFVLEHPRISTRFDL